MKDKVVIVGGPCVGKDFATKYLVDEYGYVQVRFAEGVYWIAENIFGMKKKDRRLLRFIGQGARFFWKDIWVWLTFRKVKSIIKQQRKVVISDCRQPNEIERCLKEGFTVILLEADMDIRIQRAIERDGEYPDTSLWFKESEIGAQELARKHGVVIENNGTADELKHALDNVVCDGFGDRFQHIIQKDLERMLKKLYTEGD